MLFWSAVVNAAVPATPSSPWTLPRPPTPGSPLPLGCPRIVRPPRLSAAPGPSSSGRTTVLLPQLAPNPRNSRNSPPTEDYSSTTLTQTLAPPNTSAQPSHSVSPICVRIGFLLVFNFYNLYIESNRSLRANEGKWKWRRER